MGFCYNLCYISYLNVFFFHKYIHFIVHCAKEVGNGLFRANTHTLPPRDEQTQQRSTDIHLFFSSIRYETQMWWKKKKNTEEAEYIVQEEWMFVFRWREKTKSPQKYYNWVRWMLFCIIFFFSSSVYFQCIACFRWTLNTTRTIQIYSLKRRSVFLGLFAVHRGIISTSSILSLLCSICLAQCLRREKRQCGKEDIIICSNK